MHVPCRRCAKCLQFRQMKWRERALLEVEQSPRTWFVTLTFSPVHLAGVLSEAALLKKGTEFERTQVAAYRHVQRYFKRLRKSVRFRYLAVYELGSKTGRSHYHLLIHELDRPMPKSLLERLWLSNVHARLIDKGPRSGAASYITKYTIKHHSVRMKSSSNYGKKETQTP